MNEEANQQAKPGLGGVETHSYTFDGLTLESGEWLGPVTLAYETYGRLNAERSNAILVLHAFSGDPYEIFYLGTLDLFFVRIGDDRLCDRMF